MLLGELNSGIGLANGMTRVKKALVHALVTLDWRRVWDTL